MYDLQNECIYVTWVWEDRYVNAWFLMKCFADVYQCRARYICSSHAHILQNKGLSTIGKIARMRFLIYLAAYMLVMFPKPTTRSWTSLFASFMHKQTHHTPSLVCEDKKCMYKHLSCIQKAHSNMIQSLKKEGRVNAWLSMALACVPVRVCDTKTYMKMMTSMVSNTRGLR